MGVVDHYVPRTKPYAHQQVGLELCAAQPAFGLFMDMGTGKSKVALDKAGAIATGPRRWPVLVIVIAPNGVHEKWVDHEVPTHLGPDVDAIAWGSRTVVRRAWSHLPDPTPGKIVVRSINYDQLSISPERLRKSALSNLLRDAASDGWYIIMVLDESQRIKTPSAKRTRNIIQLGKKADHRLILSGTSLTRGFEDLYSQFKFLDPNIIGIPTYTAFKQQVCVMGGFDNYQIVDYHPVAVENLINRIRPYVFQVSKDECLDLPPKIHDDWLVPLTPEQIEQYTLLREEYLLKYCDDEVPVPLALVRLLRLLQIVGGGYGVDADNYVELPQNRTKIAMELTEQALDSNDNVVIWAAFVPEVYRLMKALNERGWGKFAMSHTGKDPSDERRANRKLFQDRKLRIFVGTRASGGVGLDLTAASTVIDYSRDFNAEHWWQAEDRTHRIGQTKSVTYHHLFSPKTIERRVFDVLRLRQNLADTLKSGLARRSMLEDIPI